MAKLTKTKVKKALKDSGGIVSEIARRLDVTRMNLYIFLNKHPELKEELEHEREKIVDLAEKALIDKIKEGDSPMIKFILSTKGKNRGYIAKQEVEHIGLEPTPVNFIMYPPDETTKKPKTDKLETGQLPKKQ